MSHLMTAYDEALERGEVDPVLSATNRLGDPDELRAELQDSVPWFVKLIFSPSLNFEELILGLGDSAHFKRSAQGTVAAILYTLSVSIPSILVALIFMVMLDLLMPLDVYLKGAFCIGVLFSLSFLICVYSIRKTGLHKILHASNSSPSILKGCIAYFAITLPYLFLLFFLMLISMCIFLQISASDMFVALNNLFTTANYLIALLIFAWYTIEMLWLYSLIAKFRRRHYEEWGHLEINE